MSVLCSGVILKYVVFINILLCLSFISIWNYNCKFYGENWIANISTTLVKTMKWNMQVTKNKTLRLRGSSQDPIPLPVDAMVSLEHLSVFSHSLRILASACRWKVMLFGKLVLSYLFHLQIKFIQPIFK